MSLRLLKKQAGVTPPSEPTAGSSRGGYYGSKEPTKSRSSQGGYYAAAPSKSYYENAEDTSSTGHGRSSYYEQQKASGSRDAATEVYTGTARYVAAPHPTGGFRGSDAQKAHIDAIRAANISAASSSPRGPVAEVAVRSDLGLERLNEKKRKEEEERRAKREAARAKRRNEATQQEIDDELALASCEEQARKDAEADHRVKYEAALIVRIATCFGSSGVWMKISEARARGADIPLDPKRVYLLAHPDKCFLLEASDATAILNAQRPPEMTEVKPHVKAAPAHVATQREPEAASDIASSGAADRAEQTEERRTDPEDQQDLTLAELREKYRDAYSTDEIEEYWRSVCKPQQTQQRKSRRF